MNKMSNKTKSLLVHEYLERVGGEVLEEKNYRSALTGMIKGHEGIYVLYQKRSPLLRRVGQQFDGAR